MKYTKEDSMNQYTKGEWEVGESFGKGVDYPIYADDHYEIARVFIHNGEQKANARLIAAAPMMYEALINANSVLVFIRDNNGFQDGGIGKLACNRAIAVSNHALAEVEGK